MAAIGDSITAGAVAQFTTQSWYNPKDLIGLLYRLLRASLQNSVEPAQRKDLSWATGANNRHWVHSHYAMLSYLAERDGRSGVHVYNAAVSQEDSGDALKQLDRVVDWSVTTQSQGAPDYVTIFIGANDLCNDPGEPSTTTETYRSRITKLVHEVLVRNRKSKVLLVELPDVNRVWNFAREKKLSRLKKFQNCSVLWRSSNLCQSVLGDLTPAERQRSQNQNREYNRVLRETTAQFRSQAGRYGGDRVRLATGFFNQELNFDDQAIDCFHPNFRGQSKIGWKSFSQTWWYPQLKPRVDDYTQWVKHVVATRKYAKPKELHEPIKQRQSFARHKN
jgi:lysophospholipase L1-like esterase